MPLSPDDCHALQTDPCPQFGALLDIHLLHDFKCNSDHQSAHGRIPIARCVPRGKHPHPRPLHPAPACCLLPPRAISGHHAFASTTLPTRHCAQPSHSLGNSAPASCLLLTWVGAVWGATSCPGPHPQGRDLLPEMSPLGPAHPPSPGWELNVTLHVAQLWASQKLRGPMGSGV